MWLFTSCRDPSVFIKRSPSAQSKKKCPRLFWRSRGNGRTCGPTTTEKSRFVRLLACLHSPSDKTLKVRQVVEEHDDISSLHTTCFHSVHAVCKSYARSHNHVPCKKKSRIPFWTMVQQNLCRDDATKFSQDTMQSHQRIKHLRSHIRGAIS